MRDHLYFTAADVTPTPSASATLLGRSAALTAPSSQSSRWTTFRSASALATRCYAQVPTENEMRNIQGAKSRADAARRGKLDDIIKELLKEDM